MYSSEEEQGKQDKKTINTDEYIDWIINKEDAHVNQEIFQNILKFKSLASCIKFCSH